MRERWKRLLAAELSMPGVQPQDQRAQALGPECAWRRFDSLAPQRIRSSGTDARGIALLQTCQLESGG